MNMPRLVKLVAIIGVLATASVTSIENRAVAAEVLYSPRDSSDPQTHPDYNLDYVGFLQDEDDQDLMNFFLFFKKPVFRTQFADNLGSRAGVFIDTTGDGDTDVVVRTDNYILSADYSYVPGLAYEYRSVRRMSCEVGVYSNHRDGGYLLGLSARRSCLGLSDRFGVRGFAAHSPNSPSSKYDYAPNSWWILQAESVSTQPTTTTTTPPATTQDPPIAPADLTAAHLGAGTVRLGWTDSSNNEDGFLLQRNDTPVPAGTTVEAWPYKIPANTNTHTIPALVNNPQVCFSIASYNKAGASTFTSFVCTSTVETPTATTVVTKPGGSLTCSASWPSKKGSRSIKIATDPANAGKRLQFEIFNKAKFEPFGSGRVRADGSVVVSVPTSIAKLRGSYEIRGTQGSRFICEGTIR